MKARALALVSLMLLAVSAGAQMSRDEQKQAKAMLKGTLWLRLDVPSETGMQPFGMYRKPLIEVSPTAANTEVTSQMNIGWYHAGSTTWSVRVNDSVKVEEIEFESSTIEIEIEGVGTSEDRDSALKFIGISSLDNFKAAFDRAFSKVPLQEEHPDWPAEIRQAIADRRLVAGMSKRQTYCVIGQPESVEKKTEDGREIELWTLRTKGMEFGAWGTQTAGPQTAQILRFEDELAILDASKVSGSAVELDD